MRKIRREYTLSELTWLAWKSREQSYQMQQRTHRTVSEDTEENEVRTSAGITETKNAYYLPKGVNKGVPIPKKLVNEDGDLDLRLATGEEACHYLRSVGFSILGDMF